MKLYSYSSEFLTIAEAKWFITKLASAGILIGVIIFFGAMKLNQSAGYVIRTSSVSHLLAENEILRQQVRLMSPRVKVQEIQTKQLREHDNKLHILLNGYYIIGDTVSGLKIAYNGFDQQFLTSGEKNITP